MSIKTMDELFADAKSMATSNLHAACERCNQHISTAIASRQNTTKVWTGLDVNEHEAAESLLQQLKNHGFSAEGEMSPRHGFVVNIECQY